MKLCAYNVNFFVKKQSLAFSIDLETHYFISSTFLTHFSHPIQCVWYGTFLARYGTLLVRCNTNFTWYSTSFIQYDTLLVQYVSFWYDVFSIWFFKISRSHKFQTISLLKIIISLNKYIVMDNGLVSPVPQFKSIQEIVSYITSFSKRHFSWFISN